MALEQFKIRQKAVYRFHIQLVRNDHYRVENEVRTGGSEATFARSGRREH